MELSRRDALTALTAAGITATAGCGGSESEENGETDGTEPETKPTSMETLVALGEVLYPSDVEVTSEFVETYMFGRIASEEVYEESLAAGIATLDDIAMDLRGEPFAALDEDERVDVIQISEMRSGDSAPDGSDVERLNYHVVDELLFAFYSSPTGGELVGNPNPRGFPGGFGYRGPS